MARLTASVHSPPDQRVRRAVGANGPELTLDAIGFCRATSGRPATVSLTDLLHTEVPY